MFKFVLYLHSCIILLVTINPLQGLPLYPAVYHQEDYRHELPILVQPRDFTSYPELFMNQNQLTPYQSTLGSYNDYLRRIYVQNDEQNQRNWAAEQNRLEIQRYVTDPLDVFKQNSANNYHVLPVENNPPNNSIHCNKRKGKCKTRDNKRVIAGTHNGQQKTNCKCRKRKHAKYSTGKKCGVQSKCLRRSINNSQSVSNHSNTKDVNICRRKRPRNKPQKSCAPQEIDHSVDIKKHTSDKNSNLRDASNQNMITKNTNKLDSGLSCITTDFQTPEICKTVKNNKNKSNNCRNSSKKDDSYNCRRIGELEEYFDINEDCVYLDNRCTRNDDSIKKYQKKHNSQSDFSNTMTPYMMFNQQLFDTNGNFPTNFDYLYNMQNFLNPITNASQRRPNNRRTNRRKKPKKCNKRKGDQIKKDFQQVGSGEKNVQNISTNYFGVARSEPVSRVSTTIEESQIEKSVTDFPCHIKEEIKNTMKNINDSKENVPDNCFDEITDDYYPEFHSDNLYTSKEEYDWNHFRDKHYYLSGDMDELDRERRKYDSTNDITVNHNDNTIKHSIEVTPASNNTIENEETEILRIDIYDKEGNNNNTKLKKSSEEIHFRTPPALDFPDFKTEMINKDKNVPLAEIYYQPNKITDNRYKNNKMSAYSRVKNVESNEKINKIIDQNYVETVLGHSKVAKYGAPPNKDEVKSGVVNYHGNGGEEDKISKSSDGKTYVVIAKSLPYPI